MRGSTVGSIVIVISVCFLSQSQAQRVQKKTTTCCTDVTKKPEPTKKATSVTYVVPLPPCVDPQKVAADFAGIFPPAVKAIKPLGQRKLLFLLDPTSDENAKSSPVEDAKAQIDKLTHELNSTCSGVGVELYVYPRKASVRSNGDFAASPVPATTTLDQWKAAIPGVKSILPAFGGRFMFFIDRAPESGSASRLRDIRDVEAQIRKLVDTEYVSIPEPFVIPIPDGIGNAPTIATLLDGRIHDAQIKAIDNALLLVTPAPSDAGDPQRDRLKSKLTELVNQLAVPTAGFSAPVTGQFTRLYYLRDNTAVAAVLNNAMPDVTAAAVGSDSIMLSASVPGAQQGSRNALRAGRQLLAQMDQPHAQVSLFAWSLQLSRKEDNNTQAEREADEKDTKLQLIHSIGARFNQRIGESLNAGWVFLRRKIQTADAGYFDPVFAGYLRGQITFSGVEGEPDAIRFRSSCCRPNDATPANRVIYALGFEKLFTDLSPNLMNMLLVVAASANPLKSGYCLIDEMELKRDSPLASEDNCRQPPEEGLEPVSDVWVASCQALDQQQYDDSVNGKPAYNGFQMECTRKLLHDLFAAGKEGEQNPLLGRFRATIAEFLFRYKLMIEYPQEFDAYLEPASAAKLDAQLVEFVDAFESDLAVLNYKLRDTVAQALKGKADKRDSYAYSGIVSIKVVAGNQAVAESQAQNYFPATPPNTLADFANALSKAEASQPKILTGNLSADAVTGALAALAQVTPPKQTVSIGRELDMTVTPYTLSAANGAELDVEVTSKDNGATIVGANTTGTSTSTDDLSSRVSNHHMKTHVRLQSLKLFELSTLDSSLARGKAPWKPIDPYLEIPVVAELLRIPRHPDLIRQRSVVFLSAVVVPTAADLAATPLDEDIYQTPITGKASKLHLLSSVSNDLLQEINEYHDKVIRCLSASSTDSKGNVTGCPNIPMD